MKVAIKTIGILMVGLLVLGLIASSASAGKPGSQVGAQKDQVQGDPVVPGDTGDGNQEKDAWNPDGDGTGDGAARQGN